MSMDPPARPSSALFDVFLRLRPSGSGQPRFLSVEDGEGANSHATHITIKPPSHDNRKRAVERFAFTNVFQEDARQLDLFKGTGVVSLLEGVLGAPGYHGRDGLLATLGVTGSGKSHTILGTKKQRGLVQMTLDALFYTCADQLVPFFYGGPAFSSLTAADVSEAHMFTATVFLDSLYGDNQSERYPSRAQTPVLVLISQPIRSSCLTFNPGLPFFHWRHYLPASEDSPSIDTSTDTIGCRYQFTCRSER